MRSVMAEAARRVALEIYEHVATTPETLVALSGTRGSGTSLALREAAELLRSEGLRPVLLAPPERALDSYALALIDLAVGLEPGDAPGRPIPWLATGTWTDRLNDLRRWLDQVAARDDRLVLLVDSPGQWAVPEAVDLTARAAAAAHFLLHEISCRRVISGPEATRIARERVDLFGPSGEELLLSNDWGDLAEIASEVLVAVPGVAQGSPAHLAMVVALSALTTVPDVAQWWHPELPAETLAERVVSVLRQDTAFRPLWNAVVAMAIARRPSTREWVEDISGPIRSPAQREVLNRCFLDVWPDGALQLSRELRLASWRAEEDEFTRRSRVLAARQLNRASRAAYSDAVSEGDAAALVHAAEVLHTGAILGDPDAVGWAPVSFSDQLNAVGVNALEHGDSDRAASMFDAALDLDPDDPVARHYLAYSLDIDGREPLRVEATYRRALEQDQSHALWHSRFVSFLVVQARMEDASKSWEQGRSDLLSAGGDGPLELYSRFHVPIASITLRRAEVAFAARVLDDVPSWARLQLPTYRAQRHRLEALVQAEVWGTFVPAYRAAGRWWESGPELLSDRHSDGRPLLAWAAAGVEALTEEGIYASVAFVQGLSSPIRGSLLIGWEEVAALVTDAARAEGIDVGDFLEIGYYALGSELPNDPVIRVLERREWTEGIEAILDPTRYIARAFW